MRAARRTRIPRGLAIGLWAVACVSNPAPKLVPAAHGPAPPPSGVAVAAPEQAPPLTGLIAGRVVSVADPAPVSRARVSVTSSALAHPRVALTDPDGRYRIDQLPPGRYGLTVSKTGFVTTRYGQSATGAVADIELAAGQQSTGIDVSLAPAGALTGRILDEDGTPIARARVSAVRPRVERGEETLVVLGTTMTDDLGQFRIPGLPPGLYYVAASDPAFDQVGDAAGLLEYSPTYYPGTVFPDEATRVKIDAGRASAPAEFRLLLVRPARVSGRLAAVDGRQLLSGAVIMTAQHGESLAALPIRDVVITPFGAFTFRNVPPGHYVIRARGETERQGLSLFGRFALDVEGRDVGNLTISLTPGAHVAGRVEFDGRTPPAGEALAAIRVQAVTIDGVSFADAFSNPLAPNGSFEFRGVMPGDHVFRLRGLPEGWSLQGVFAMGREVTDLPMALDGGQQVANLLVVVSDVTTTLSGRVTDERDRPRPDALVVVFPTDASLWARYSRHVRQARPDLDGHYRVRGLPAGEYLIIATDELDEADVLTPQVLERLSAQAGRLTLRVGETRTDDLRVTRLRPQIANGHEH